MIQRTLFNNLTVDRIEEILAVQFAGKIEPYIKEWREWIEAGQVHGLGFYISVNSQFEMDGILLHHKEAKTGTIFALSSEAAQNLIERARKAGDIQTFDGDSESCKWVL